MKKIIFVFIILIILQAVFSFLFPSYNNSDYWRTVKDLNFYKGYSFSSADNALLDRFYPFIKNYHMNLDAGGYLLLAHNFPHHYFQGHLTFLTRPLYPLLVNLIARPLHLISNSYAMTFLAGLFVNFILFFFTVFLFYLLVKKIISARVAFISSILLIFSPFSHIWLIQPETNIFGIFAIISSLYLVYDYIKFPSLKKLIIFSFIIGILLLGKKIFAISIFILILAIWSKRFKEGITFLVLHLLPLLLWLVWIKSFWHLPMYVDEVSHFDYGIWLLNIFYWPWYQTFKIFLDSVPRFITSLIYGFLLIPVVLAFIGYAKLKLENKRLIIFGFLFSFFLLFFGMQYFSPRFGFMLFPLVYPLAVLGIERMSGGLQKYGNRYGLVFSFLIYGLMIFISSLNIYKFVYYG